MAMNKPRTMRTMGEIQNGYKKARTIDEIRKNPQDTSWAAQAARPVAQGIGSWLSELAQRSAEQQQRRLEEQERQRRIEQSRQRNANARALMTGVKYGHTDTDSLFQNSSATRGLRGNMLGMTGEEYGDAVKEIRARNATLTDPTI